MEDNNQFFAESPEALLGLASIYEAVGEDWNTYSLYDTKHIFQREIPESI